MLIAVPSDAPGGLDARVSDHFGHCASFTLVSVDDGQVGEVTILENEGHEHGGCMAPVMLLKAREVDTLLAGGMGMRPLAGFQQVGISVYSKQDASTVRDAVALFIEGSCPEFGQAQTCGGGNGECGGHHHHHHEEDVERDPIEGVADVRADRVVSLDYRLTDGDGSLLDESAGHGPLRYLHGHGNIVPGLEQALAGLEAGATLVVEVPAAEAYGERDESSIFEVPRGQLPGHLTVGDRVRAQLGDGHLVTLTVVEVGDESVRLDPNHPLAGKDLVFDVTIVKVESATPNELAHGHVH